MDPERRPLLNGSTHDQSLPAYQASRLRRVVGSSLVVLFAVVVVVSVFVRSERAGADTPERVVDSVLSRAGVFDGHIDLPIHARYAYRNNISAFDLNDRNMTGHVDIPRLRKGHVGGFFWSVYMGCPPAGDDFTVPNWSVRDTLEQIDVSKNLIDKYSDTFSLVASAEGIQRALYQGKIASLLGVEGAHQLGNSLGVLRMYYDLGVRYMTLTHMCHNAFADSGGYLTPLPRPLHNGLSEFGQVLIREMNRLGIIIDLSHTSDETAEQALKLSAAPVIWSHSSARSIWNVARNVPNSILRLIGDGPDQKDAVVMINFSPDFVGAEGNATVQTVVDHIEHIANVAGKQYVGIGSDYDGISSTPEGLEDASKYPNLFYELYQRGWTREQLEGLAVSNFLRIFHQVEEVSYKMRTEGLTPAMQLYEGRNDL